MSKIIEFFIRRSLFGNFITIAVILGGVIIAFNMQREALPIIDFDIILINTSYPGASPREVEKIVTTPIERELKSVDDVKEMTSTSLYARSTIVIKLEPDIENKLKIIQDIKDAVDIAKIDFPEDVYDPVVTEISTKKTPVIQILISSEESDLSTDKTESQRKLRLYADRLEDKIELLPEVASISKAGYLDREFQVEVFPEKMVQYNVSSDDIINALKMRNLNLPGGTVIEGKNEYSIRTVKEFENIEEMQNLFIRANDLGNYIKLKDIANVKDAFEKESIIEKNMGKDAIVLTILKKEKSDAIRLVDGIMKDIKEFKKSAPEDINVETANDLSFYIKRRLNVLQNNIIIGIILVMLSLYFFLGWRVSLMVAIGLPFSFAMSFFFLSYFDITINLISMFGLIVVSGMIVDDAIVVGENIYRHLEQGESSVSAAMKGSKEMVAPVFGSISTTMVAFAPLMFMGGIFGKFVFAIPAVVIIALASSLFESFLILPAHISDITHNQKRKDIIKNEKSMEFRFFRWLQSIYQPSLEFALKRRYLTIFIVFLSFAVGIVLLPQTGFILFPKEGVEILFMKFEGPRGISLSEMETRMQPLQNLISGMDKNELDNFQSRIGIHQESTADPFTKRGENYGQIVLYLTPEEERTRYAEEIVSYFKRYIDPFHPISNMGRVHPEDSKVYIFNTLKKMKLDNLMSPGRNADDIPLKTDYMIGGGVIAPGKMLLYDAANTAYIYNMKENKVLKKKKIRLRKYDFMKKVLALRKKPYSYLITEKNRLYKIDHRDLDISYLHIFDSEVTSLRYLKEKEALFVTTSAGSLEVFNIEPDADISIKKSVTKGPLKKIQGDDIKFDYRINKLKALPRIEYGTYSGNNKFLLAAFDGSVYEYSCKDEKITSAWHINSKPIYWVMKDLHNSNKLWISQIDQLLLYDIETSSIVKSFKIKGYLQFGFIVDNHLIAYGSNDLIVKINSAGRITVLREKDRNFEKIEFKKAGRGGPPVGSPVQIEVSGDEFEPLLEISSKVQKYLNTIPGVYDVRDNWEEGKEEFRVEINEQRAAMAGVSTFQIASTLQTAFEGRIATTVKKSKEEIDIRVLFPEKLRKRLSSLKKVMVRNQVGNLVPLTELATFKKYPGVSMITHVDSKRTLYIRANIDESKTSSINVNNQIMEIIKKKIQSEYPDYQIKASGEIADTQESMGDLGKAAAVAIAGISAILILLFGNLRHPRVIMMAIPLGFIGVSLAFFLHKVTYYPNLVFSFLASMGIVGLAGVVVNDSIVLVDFINKLRKSGVPKNRAIITAGVFRLRAVILTTVTTVFGLLPTAYGIGGSDPFLRPMALAMAWGLAFATIITLIFVPVYYAVWEDRGFVFHHEIGSKLKKLGELDEE